MAHKEVIPAAEALVALQAAEKRVELDILVGAEGAALDEINDGGESRIGHEFALGPLGPQTGHLLLPAPEEEEILLTNLLADLDVRPVVGADDQAPVHREFHV